MTNESILSGVVPIVVDRAHDLKHGAKTILSGQSTQPAASSREVQFWHGLCRPVETHSCAKLAGPFRGNHLKWDEKKMVQRRQSSLFVLPSLLVCHADDLDFVSSHGIVVVQLEVDVLDEKGPDIVAEAIGIERTLW